MAKKVAVLAVNPVNGLGLFTYLETFYENKIEFKLYAVSDTTAIHANSGVALKADDVVFSLKGHADDFDALVFSCGDAIPAFQAHASESYNLAMVDVIREFAAKEKLIIGHCAAALIFEKAGITAGKKVSVHPMAKVAIRRGYATDAPYEIDGLLFTAQNEHSIQVMMPALLEVLR
ncbi:MAG TPA: DJ-1/PfpI family protein [Candidatus Caccoplasma merdavium]|nr:DJ-1/PfpI family protein [Candidatus Caccoplasma merdavium]